MRKFFIISLLILAIDSVAQTNSTSLSYIENKGQWNKEILYQSDFTQGKAIITQNALKVIVLDSTNLYFHPHDTTKYDKLEKYSVFSIAPYNSKISSCNIIATDTTKGYYNYFIGNDYTKHASNVKAYKSVVYNEIYKGINWSISSWDGLPKHSYIVKPYANANQIQTIYKGVDSLFVKDSFLYILTAQGLIKESKLLVYQINNNKITTIKAKYNIQQTKEGYLVSYSIDNYNKNKDLIIDPGLVFSTYSGSHSDNWGMTSCYDKNHYMLSGGIVKGQNYNITEGAYDTVYHGDWDVVITKYDAWGENMIFSTFIGGLYAEMPHSMVVNENNEVVIFGTTGSSDFPTTDNSFQRQFAQGEALWYDRALNFPNGCDIFVTTLSEGGNNLVGSTFVGGSRNDGLNYKPWIENSSITLYLGNDSLYYNYGDCARGEVVTDHNNNVYIATCSFSRNFPVTNGAYQTTVNFSQNAVVFKLNHTLSELLYSTYLGGSKDDAAYSIDLDKDNNAYICGGTTSTDFPVTDSAYNTSFNGGTTDAFICKLSSNGKSLIASSYFGSNKYDQSYIIRLDKDQIPYIFGQTLALDSTLIHNVGYSVPNSGQFVAKFSNNLSSLLLSTVWGTGDTMVNVSPSGFAVDLCGRVYCAGWGRVFKYMKNYANVSHLGTEFLPTTSDAYMDTTDGTDFYIISFDKDINYIDYATFFGEYNSATNIGNDHVDGGTSRFDAFGNFYLSVCASCGASQGFPTTLNAFSSSNNASNCNMASAKIEIHNDFAVANFSCKQVVCKGDDITFTNNSRGDNFLWDFGDNTPTDTNQNPTHSYLKSGVYNIRLVSNLNNGCRLSDTTYKKILVLSDTSYYLDTIHICSNQKVYIGIGDFSYYSDSDVSFDWSPDSLLLEAHSPNPLALVDSSTLFRLVISTPYCSDTLYRFVKTNTLSIDSIITFPSGCSSQREGKAIAITSNDYPITYRWSCSDDNVDSVSSLQGGTYSLQITDTMGCMASKEFIISSSEQFTVLDSIKDIGCWSWCDGSIMIEVQGGKAPFDYKWSNGNESQINDSLCAGIYNVVITDSNNCQVTMSYQVKEFEYPYHLNAAVDKDSVFDGEQIFLSCDYLEGFTYQWTPKDNLNKPTNYQTEGRVYQSTTFFVSATNKDGCSTVDSVHVDVKYIDCSEANIFVANAFTPNNDGKNDVIKVEGDNISEMDFRIYNRWGENVFHSTSISDYWDGKYRDKDCPNGVYYYRLEVKCLGGKTFFTSGDITLIR